LFVRRWRGPFEVKVGQQQQSKEIEMC